MRNTLKAILIVITLAVCMATVPAEKNPAIQTFQTIETIAIEPIELENISLWVPIAKAGPLINRSCHIKESCLYSYELPSSVHHAKSENCPTEVARLLAEYVSACHERGLPLTIFNGWQWEYLDNLNRCESVTYDLPDHGGCWENSWEGILILTAGTIDFKWILNTVREKPTNGAQYSSIRVQTFSSVIRTRDGYPQKLQLK
jgi:hypothetical protein